jgi:hypothetical protein
MGGLFAFAREEAALEMCPDKKTARTFELFVPGGQ